VFDLALRVQVSGQEEGDSGGRGWQILHVYGSPNSNESALSSDGTVMKVRAQSRRQRRPPALLAGLEGERALLASAAG
jgi:hypothetical protein